MSSLSNLDEQLHYLIVEDCGLLHRSSDVVLKTQNAYIQKSLPQQKFDPYSKHCKFKANLTAQAFEIDYRVSSDQRA